MDHRIEEHRFDAGEVELNYAEMPGAGLPLVMLHGGAARWQTFAGIVPDLAVMAALEDAPAWRGDAGAPRMRELLGEHHPMFAALAENLYMQDPEVLTAMLDDFERFVAGYDMRALLPAIRCPVLLLQADPAAGAVMGDAEVQQGLALLVQGSHVQFAGIGHAFHNERPDLVVEAINRWYRGLSPSS